MAEWDDTVSQAARRAEREVQRLIEYLNDEVVPDVRRHSSSALRVAADRLQELASAMDDKGGSSGEGKPRT